MSIRLNLEKTVITIAMLRNINTNAVNFFGRFILQCVEKLDMRSISDIRALEAPLTFIKVFKFCFNYGVKL